MKRRAKWLWRAIFAVAALTCVVFGWLYYVLYWQWRDCFNSEGKCFDAVNLVVYEQETQLFVVPVFLAVMVGSIALCKLVKK